MGDIADMLIDQAMEEMLDGERDFDDPRGYYPAPKKRQPTQCKYCKALDVEWKETSKGWRMFDHGGLRHDCSASRKAPQTCKYCGQGALFWHDTDYGWRLFTSDNEQHRCLEQP